MAYTEQNKKDHIYEVQNYLRTIAQVNDNIPAIIPSGVYDEKTEDAVRQFQREYGLPITGKIDIDTWESIVEVYLSAEEYYRINSSIMLLQNSSRSINEGDSGSPVYILQAVLNTISDFYSNMDSIEVDGIYGKETADAVRKIQEIVGEPRSGNLDYKTWNKLAQLYNYHVMQSSGQMSVPEAAAADKLSDKGV